VNVVLSANAYDLVRKGSEFDFHKQLKLFEYFHLYRLQTVWLTERRKAEYRSKRWSVRRNKSFIGFCCRLHKSFISRVDDKGMPI